MRLKAIHTLVSAVCLAVIAGVISLDLEPLTQLAGRDLLGLAALIALGLLAEYLALTIDVSKNKGASTITFLPCLTTLLVFGPAAGTLYMMLVGGIGEFGFRRKPLLKATFNTAQYGLSMLIAGWAFEWAGGVPGGSRRHLWSPASPVRRWSNRLPGIQSGLRIPRYYRQPRAVLQAGLPSPSQQVRHKPTLRLAGQSDRDRVGIPVCNLVGPGAAGLISAPPIRPPLLPHQPCPTADQQGSPKGVGESDRDSGPLYVRSLTAGCSTFGPNRPGHGGCRLKAGSDRDCGVAPRYWQDRGDLY